MISFIPAVRSKERKLSKNKRDLAKKQDYLGQPFYLKSKATEADQPPARKKRVSSNGIVVEQVNEPSSLAEDAYASLMKDHLALQNSFKALQEECSILKHRLKKECSRRLVQEGHRAKAAALLWRQKYSKFKREISMQSEVKRLKSSLTTCRSYYRKKLAEKAQAVKKLTQEHRKKTQMLNEDHLYLENELQVHQEMMKKTEAEDNEFIETKVKGRYTDQMRMAVYHQTTHGCPVDHAGSVVANIVKEFTGKTVRFPVWSESLALCPIFRPARL
jgi:hypothetical protein